MIGRIWLIIKLVFGYLFLKWWIGFCMTLTPIIWFSNWWMGTGNENVEPMNVALSLVCLLPLATIGIICVVRWLLGKKDWEEGGYD